MLIQRQAMSTVIDTDTENDAVKEIEKYILEDAIETKCKILSLPYSTSSLY